MRISVIGVGKVGTALAHTLKQKGFDVAAVADSRQESLDRARAYIGPDCVYTLDVNEAALLADVVAVTTQDREIKKVAAFLAGQENDLRGKVFFHTSGAHTSAELSPLDEKGAIIGSLHPLETFPDIDAGIAALPETHVFIEGGAAALAVLREIGSAVGREVVVIERDKKVLYHLSAVFVCNLLTALLYAGEAIMVKAGVELEHLFPIMNTTLKNIEERGPLASLTGPVVRGDVDTVAAHLNVMKGMGLPVEVYKSLSKVAVKMAEEQRALSAEQVFTLKRLLEQV